MHERGNLKQGKHEGYYSINEETFFAEKDLVKDESVSPIVFRTEAGEKVELIEERNYVFEITPEMKEVVKEWMTRPSVGSQ